MGLLPNKKAEKLNWIKSHAQRWAEDPDLVGLTAEEITAITAQVDTALAQIVAAEAAQTAARAATAEGNRNVDETVNLAMQAIQRIRAYARGQQDPAVVYEAAGFPERKKSSAPGELLPPTGLSFTLQSDGSVAIACKPGRARGRVVTVQRRVGFADQAESAWETVVTQGGHAFVDRTVPAGATKVEYQLRAHRGTQVSLWSDPVTVRFTALDGEAQPNMRLAA